MPKGGPRGLRASEHLEAAHNHDELGRETVTWPETTSPTPDTRGVPWVRSWDAGAEHERAAAKHRSEAAALHAEFDEACGTRGAEDIAISPLVKYAIGGWPTSTGVIMYLTPKSGSPEQLLADLRCHRAWMMLAPQGMDDCPLDLPGLVLDARGDEGSVTLSIVVKDPALVDELHRRAAHELEMSQRAGMRSRSE